MIKSRDDSTTTEDISTTQSHIGFTGQGRARQGRAGQGRGNRCKAASTYHNAINHNNGRTELSRENRRNQTIKARK